MQPANRELVEQVAAVLRERIAPLLADQPWPSSELRSIDWLLRLVAARIEHETEVLEADNADLDELLESLAASGIELAPLEAADGATLHDANVARRAALEEAIHLLHDGAHEAEVAAVRAYLRAAVEREQQIYGDLAGRPLF